MYLFFFFSSRRRHTRWTGDWSSDVCSSDLEGEQLMAEADAEGRQLSEVDDAAQRVHDHVQFGWISGSVADDEPGRDRKSTRLNSSHPSISYAVFCLKKKKKTKERIYRDKQS